MSEPVDTTSGDLADLIRAHLAGGLLAFDVDGVLAPLPREVASHSLDNAPWGKRGAARVGSRVRGMEFDGSFDTPSIRLEGGENSWMQSLARITRPGERSGAPLTGGARRATRGGNIPPGFPTRLAADAPDEPNSWSMYSIPVG